MEWVMTIGGLAILFFMAVIVPFMIRNKAAANERLRLERADYLKREREQRIAAARSPTPAVDPTDDENYRPTGEDGKPVWYHEDEFDLAIAIYDLEKQGLFADRKSQPLVARVLTLWREYEARYGAPYSCTDPDRRKKLAALDRSMRPAS